MGKLSRKGWQFNQIVLISPDDGFEVEDKDDFMNFVEIARDNSTRDDGITEIHLRVLHPTLPVIVLQVCPLHMASHGN